MKRQASLEVSAVWVVVVGILFLIAAFGWLQSSNANKDLENRLYRACEQYAGLDLSGLATLCRDVGYQEVVYLP